MSSTAEIYCLAVKYPLSNEQSHTSTLKETLNPFVSDDPESPTARDISGKGDLSQDMSGQTANSIGEACSRVSISSNNGNHKRDSCRRSVVSLDDFDSFTVQGGGLKGF